MKHGLTRPVSAVALSGAVALMLANFENIARKEKAILDVVFPVPNLPQPDAPQPQARSATFHVDHSKSGGDCIRPSSSATERIEPGTLSWQNEYHGGNDQSYPEPAWVKQGSVDVICAKAACIAPHPNDWGCSGDVIMTATEFFKAPPPAPPENALRSVGYQVTVGITFLIPVVAWLWSIVPPWRRVYRS